MDPITIVAIIVGVLAFGLIFVYNNFISLINRTKEAWSDINVQLKRRYDLIPNLVETVKGYATHEKAVFEKVTEARSKALSATSVSDKGTADNMVTQALKSVFAVAEAYPQLRAAENFTNLQNQLAETENNIQAARRFYNGNVRELNIMIESFPYSLLAGIFGFKKWDYFQAEGENVAEPVKVSFQ